MKLSEWAVVAGTIRSYWPYAPAADDDALRMQADLVQDVDFGAAMLAVKARARRGEKYAPNPGEIAADVLGERAGRALPWSEVRQLMQRSASRSTPAAALAWITEQNAAVGAWIADRGWSSIAHAQVDDPVHGARVERELRQDFEQFVEARPSLSQGALTAPARTAIGSGR